MSNSSYPSLLNSKATILANFTRFDLAIIGASYLALSWFKVSGLISLGVNALIYLTLKLIQRKLPKGYFKGIRSSSVYEWSYKLGNIL